MKNLFTLLVVSLCGTMAYAQTGAISVNDVTIAKGGSTQMEVTVNNAAVDQKNVDGIIANNRITGNALDNVDIALYYDKVVEEAATTEGGEGK